jgi:hypothetical protein
VCRLWQEFRGIWIRGILLLILVSAAVAILHRTYHYLRGRRNRDRGFPCVQCQRTAFPIEGTVRQYRCASCGLRFEGPEHF